MNRTDELKRFIEYDYENDGVIEPEKRAQDLLTRLEDIIAAFTPAVIVKAGVGSGTLLAGIAKAGDAYIVVVEPSMKVISSFMQEHGQDDGIDRVHFINGEFNDFPVDYYAADLLVSIDNFDFIESGRALDEFRRALQFEGLLFIGTVIIEKDDIEGVYDDFIRTLFPLHNDYYLEQDLKTFMELNEFSFVRGSSTSYEADLGRRMSYFSAFTGRDTSAPSEFLNGHSKDFERLYSLSGDSISEPYFTGVFRRIKPDKDGSLKV